MTTWTGTAETLELDQESLSPEALSIPALMRELVLQKRPSWILSTLMNTLERKRQAKGLGWSRIWNKEGMRIFRTHTQQIEKDANYFTPLDQLLEQFLAKAPVEQLGFVRGLLKDPLRMSFTFYHNHTTETGAQYEGLTVSIGRKHLLDPSKRDRLDILLEDARTGGAVDGKVDRLRIYVCPWENYANGRQYHLEEVDLLHRPNWELAQKVYSNCVNHYHLWKGEETRQWNHWSSRYIDYFGAREFIPRGSSFI